MNPILDFAKRMPNLAEFWKRVQQPCPLLQDKTNFVRLGIEGVGLTGLDGTTYRGQAAIDKMRELGIIS